MIKLETHCHVAGASLCAHAGAEYIVNAYKKAGYGGIVLTNHLHPSQYIPYYPGETHKEKIDYWYSIADNFRKVGESAGLKIFIGVEVCVYRSDGKYSECTLYGFDKSFLYDNKALFYFSQEELFRLAEKGKMFMYQTHPFRTFISPCDPKFMHGAEAFNGHVGHTNNNDKANEFCNCYSLIKMSGTDFHDEGQAITGGIYLPDNINDEFQLAQYLLNDKPQLIIEKELYDKEFKGRP